MRQLFEAFYAADDEAMSELIGDDFVTQAPGGSIGNADGWKAMAHQLLAAIPDNRTQIDDIIGCGDTVAVRSTSRGTHDGELFGVRGDEPAADDLGHRDVPPVGRAGRRMLGSVRHEPVVHAGVVSRAD